VSEAADVVVIGGGVIGSAVAYYAAKKGLRVTLVDQPKRGKATTASAGGLWPIGESVGLGCGVIFHKTMAKTGRVPDNGPAPLPACFFEFAIRSNAMFPSLAAELRETTGIDVEYDACSLLFLMFDDGDESFARSVSERCPPGARQPERLSREDLAKAEPAVSREARGALLFRGDDQINPYRLADALRAGAKHHGAMIRSHVEVTALRVESGRVTAVETSEGLIPCEVAINAAGTWAPRIGQMIGLEIPVRPVRGQILGTQSPPKLISACLSTADCYLAQKKHGEVIVGSTTEEVGFDTGVTASAMKSLAAGAIRAVPALENVGVKRVWSGLRPGTPDELPILGPVEGIGGYLNASGHFRTGILNAPLTGLLLAELLTNEPLSLPIEPFLLARFAGKGS